MPHEREYSSVSLNRVDALNKAQFDGHQRIERNKQIIDNYVMQDPTRVDDPDVISKMDITRSQDKANIEKAKEFSEQYYHELVDIAMSEAAKAGKTIIDARDEFDDKKDAELAAIEAEEAAIATARDEDPFAFLKDMHVVGKQDLVNARLNFVKKYLKDNNLNLKTMTLEEKLKIRELPGWENPRETE